MSKKKINKTENPIFVSKYSYERCIRSGSFMTEIFYINSNHRGQTKYHCSLVGFRLCLKRK